MNILLTVLMWLIGILFGIAMLFGIGLLIYLRGKKSIEEDPNNALIFNLAGNHFRRPFKGKMIDRNSTSTTFQYNKRNLAIVPHKHEVLYYNGKRFLFMINSRIFPTNLLFQKINANTALPSVISDKVTEVLSDSEKETLIEELILSNVGSGAVSAIKGKNTTAFNIILIVVALGIGIIGTFGFMQFQEQIGLNNQAQQQPPPAQQQIIPTK